MYKAIEIAYWFLFKNYEKKKENIATNEFFEVYEGLTHIKLQMLLYNAQGCSLAINNEPLFEEPLVVWESSPVVEKVYDKYVVFENQTIIMPYTKDIDEIITKLDKDAKTKAVLEFVYNNFNIYTAWELKKMATESNTPWAKTQMDSVIEHELIKEYFKKEVLEE